MKKVLTTLAFITFAIVANAQFTVQLGYNNVNMETTFTPTIAGVNDTTVFDGFYLGATYNFSIAGNFGIEPGIRASYVNWNEEITTLGITAKTKSELVNISIPVMLNYRFDFGKDMHLTLYAGPTLDYGLVAKTTNEVSGSKTTENLFEDDGTGLYLNKLDILAETGAGFRWSNWGVQFRIAWGFLNLAHNPNNSPITVDVASTKMMIGFSYTF